MAIDIYPYINKRMANGDMKADIAEMAYLGGIIMAIAKRNFLKPNTYNVFTITVNKQDSKTDIIPQTQTKKLIKKKKK